MSIYDNINNIPYNKYNNNINLFNKIELSNKTSKKAILNTKNVPCNVQVPGDRTYESPVTPHHGLHHDRYVSFEYDQGKR